jgi:hypothetical protein
MLEAVEKVRPVTVPLMIAPVVVLEADEKGVGVSGEFVEGADPPHDKLPATEHTPRKIAIVRMIMLQREQDAFRQALAKMSILFSVLRPMRSAETHAGAR